MRKVNKNSSDTEVVIEAKRQRRVPNGNMRERILVDEEDLQKLHNEDIVYKYSTTRRSADVVFFRSTGRGDNRYLQPLSHFILGIDSAKDDQHKVFHLNGDHRDFRKGNLYIGGKDEKPSDIKLYHHFSNYKYQNGSRKGKEVQENKNSVSGELIEYIYNERGEKIGAMVATSPFNIGWSLCAKEDQFSKKEGKRIARSRLRIPYQVSFLKRLASQTNTVDPNSYTFEQIQDWFENWFIKSSIREKPAPSGAKLHRFHILHDHLIKMRDRADRYFK